MENKTIIVESGRVSRIRLNRPEKRNALSVGMMKEITAALLELDQDPAVAAIVLSGNGGGFCAGADLSEMNSAGLYASRESKAHIMNVLTTMSKIGKIVISSVHGFALAGGFGLAVTADLTIVSDDCKLGMPEIKRGLAPMNIMNPISRIMPRKPLLEMLFTGRIITPRQAVEWGLVNKVAAKEDLEKETVSLAQSIAENSSAALRLCKNAFYNMQNMDYYTAFSYLTEMLAINAGLEDAREGVAAFTEKRAPLWSDK